MTTITESDYISRFRGAFINMLRWEQFDQLWEKLRNDSHPWYVYKLDESVPTQPVDKSTWPEFLAQLAEQLRSQHGEDYCGIVYADNPEQPTYIKIYDPNNLGVVCGISDLPPPLPGWVLSHEAPVTIDRNIFTVKKRQPWWKFLWKK